MLPTNEPGNNGNTTLTAALAYRRANISFIPVRRDGSKAPESSLLPTELNENDGKFKPTWNPFRERLPTDAEVDKWFNRPEPPGIGIIGGEISGNLEQIDFDTRAETIFPEWRQLVETQCPGLVEHLSIARTPKPGFHVRYRCLEIVIPGNTKLAIDPALVGKERTLIETRGKGGYALAPGCPAECHETGRLYEHYSGPKLSQIQTITAAEREVLIRCARAFNLVPAEEAADPPDNQTDQLLPGEDYNVRGPDWAEILTPHGWALAGQTENKRLWRRPGKDHGWSATTGFCTSKVGNLDLLALFSSNAAPFPPPAGEKTCATFNKFSAYCILNHRGDFSAAARALGQQGYGGQSRRQGPSDRPHDETPKRDAPKSPTFPAPIPASCLKASSLATWLWQGCLSRGGITLLSALWKIGKTTLLTHLMKGMQEGGTFCGMDLEPGRVLYVTEESESRWAERRDRLDLKDHLHFLVRPFGNKSTWESWQGFLNHLQDLGRHQLYDLIVFDTLVNLWPVKDENDAGQVQTALMPLHRVAPQAALLLTHHPRKGDGQEATASRGSGALTAFVDTILEMRRYDASDRKDRRRVLTGYGRHDETPEELVIELTEAGEYVAKGSKREVGCLELSVAIARMLPNEPLGFTEEQIREKWPESPKPGKGKLLDVLRAGTGRDWHREGEGRKGSPFTYWIAAPE